MQNNPTPHATAEHTPRAVAPGLLRAHWDQIDGLLDRAVELPLAQRRALIEHEMPEPGPLQDLTLRLVANLDDGEDRMVKPSPALMRAAFDHLNDEDAGDLAPGTRVGAFTVVERIARGGMATVYSADRSDGAYGQRVALKVLRRGLDTDDLIRRFRTERQILSLLTHPNITRLLDGGALDDGRPWLAIELVIGQCVTEHADARQLTLRARLQLFLAITDAVQDAHRQLVVHRDIKPSNVLVDEDGRVRLLDFGIAKLLDAGSQHTEVGMQPLTRAYAAPEQLSGGQITTATDVYQLGLLLRELLTGVGPHSEAAPETTGARRVSRLARQSFAGIAPPEIRARNRATLPDRLAQSLAGDLDCVIAKALREEPGQRYTGAGELAADVRAYLAGRAVSAHPESLGYRVTKFVARNRLTAFAIAASVMLLSAYAVTATVQARRLAVARDAATREAQKAAEVSEFMVSLFQSADPDLRAGEPVSAAELLSIGARQLQEDPVRDPLARAAMQSAIGRSFEAVGAYLEAEQELEAALQSYAAAKRPDLVAEATTRHRLALVVMYRDVERALEILSVARTQAEGALGASHPIVADMMVDYAELRGRLSADEPTTDSLLVRAVSALRAAGDAERARLANALTVWGRGRDPELAIPRMREALALRRAVYPEMHTAVATSLSDLALATEPSDPYAADTLLSHALAIVRQVQGTRGALLMSVMNNLAAVRRDRGAFAEALPLYREVLALRRELYPEHEVPLAYTLYGLGVVLTELGNAAEAVQYLREGTRILDSTRPGTPAAGLMRAALQRAEGVVKAW